MYLIDPSMPEMDVIYQHDGAVSSCAGSCAVLWKSLVSPVWLTCQQLARPASPVEQRIQAALARRPHYWALAQEWYATPVSSQQTGSSDPPRCDSKWPIPKTSSEAEIIKVLDRFRPIWLPAPAGASLSSSRTSITRN